jgi:cytochrome c553
MMSPGFAANPQAIASVAPVASAANSSAAACSACHGARGEGMAAFPRLAGVSAAYLRRQLEAFATGQRKNAIMQPIAQNLSIQQRDEVAAFFASLPPSVHADDIEPKNANDIGAWLATRGRWDKDLPACAQCHGPGGVGVGTTFPPLVGQPSDYLEQQLKAWRAGERPPGPLGLMQLIARKLSDADIKAVSDYYAQLPNHQAATPVQTARKGAQ